MVLKQFQLTDTKKSLDYLRQIIIVCNTHPMQLLPFYSHKLFTTFTFLLVLTFFTQWLRLKVTFSTLNHNH